MEKLCTKCKELLPTTDFYIDTRAKSGLYSRCKKCHNKVPTHRNTEEQRARERTRRKIREEKYKKLYGYTWNSMYRKNRRAVDVQFKLRTLLRARLQNIMKNNKFKMGSAVRDLGCTIPELMVHLERKFQPGMTWKNWSRTGWHIDHIKPLALFDLTDRQEFLKAFHYTNLQPLWAKENLQKGTSF